MAAEVVGTAFVRIRALTTGLAKDIQDGLDKGAASVDADDAGAKLGKGFADAAGKEIKEGIEDAVGDSTKDIDQKVDVDGGRRAGDRLAESIKEGLRDTFGKIGKEIQEQLGLDDRQGKKTGGVFGKGLAGGMRGALIKAAAIFSPAILGAGSLLIQYVVALTAQLGFLATAAVGAGAALGSVFGAALLGLIPLILAFTAQTPQLERFKAIAEDVGGAWKEVGAATQETLLPSLTRVLRRSEQLIPMFRAFGREVGRVAGNFAELAAEELASIEGQIRLRTILQGSSRILDSLSEVAFNFFTIFIDFFRAALPLGERFADSLERITDRWQNIVSQGADSGTLTDTLTVWYDRASLVAGALGDLFVALWNILQVGATSAVPFFDNFSTWAQEFREFTESAAGQNKLKQIFDDAREVAQEFNGLIADIFEAIGGQVFDAGGNEGIIGFIRVLREDIIPLLDGFVSHIKDDYGPALVEFFDAFGAFLAQIAEAEGLNVALATLTGTFDALTTVLETLMQIPGFDTFLGFLLGIAGAFAILKAIGVVALVGNIVGVLGSLAGAFSSVAAVVASGLGVGVVASFGIVIAIIAAIVAAVVLLVIHWDKVKAAFAATVRFLKDPEKRLIALRENIENLVGTLREKLGQALGAAGRALVRFGGIIREKVEDAVGSVIEFLTRLPGMAVSALAGLGGALLELIVGALAAVGQALPGALNTIAGFFVTLPIRIIEALSNLALFLLEAFINVHIIVVEWIVNTGIPSIVDFFKQIPGFIAGALAGLSNMLLGLFTRALSGVINFIRTNGPKVLEFFRTLPGKVADFLADLPGTILKAFSDAFTAVTRAIYIFITVTLPGFATSMLDAGSNLIDKLVEGLGKTISGTSDIAKDIVNGIIGFVNEKLIHPLNDLLEFDFKVRGFGFTVNAPDIRDIPELAMGGIFDRPTFAEIGEAGREVVIPLTNPRRALDLFNQSGLAQVLARARPSSTASNGTAAPAGVGLSIGHLEVKANDVVSAWNETHTEIRALARGRFR